MEVKGWERIKDVFHAALPLGGAERVSYLDGECEGNATLRAEVESLLAAFEKRGGFMEEPAFDLAMKVLGGAAAESMVGRRLGPYQILSQLGSGGMGEVYLAEDTRLGRRVALKFLSTTLADDNWAKRQLVREAQAVATLDHPNICAVYGIDEADGLSFIVMQYIEGYTLADLIRTQFPEVQQTVSFAVQIVSAVAHAHAYGIIHRDIKPRNIVVTASGQVKVLDFGLAKTVQREYKVGVPAEDSSRISQNGFVVGTLAYMSPEQLRAEKLDFRSDIFSLGAMFYEMVSGKKPFARDSDAETISAILASYPAPLTRAAEDIPPGLEHIIFKCLEKDKERRYQSASELLYELNVLQKGEEFTPRKLWYLGRRAVAALFLFVLIAASAFAYLRLTRAQTLAVLPIINANADPELEPLCSGLTEDLINQLSRVSKLRVKALTVVSGYRGQDVDPLEVGRTIDVDAVFTGSLVRRGEALVLQTSVIDVSDHSQVWGEKFSVRPEQIISLREEVSEKVISSLSVQVAEGERKRLAERPTNNPEAQREYYSGRNLWEKRSKQNIRDIIAHFERAIELDASYAEPYAGLADCYALTNTVAYLNMPTAEAMKKARYMALRALELNDSLPEAHIALGVVKLKYEWKWQEAEGEFKRAIALKPDHAWAHYWYSHLLAVAGRWGEAIAEGSAANDLAPFSHSAAVNYCRSYYYARQYDRAAACFNEILKKAPDYAGAQYVLSYVYMQKGMYPEAIGILEKLYERDKSLAAAPLGYAYGRSGRKADALKILNDLREISLLESANGGQVPAHEETLIYIGLGDKDAAFARLEKSYGERFVSLIYLNADPIYDSLRSDSRFADFMRRLNLMPAAPPA